DLDRVGHDAVADPDRRPGWVIQRLADELLGLVPVRDRRASAERSDLPLALTPAPVSLVLLLRHALDAALDASCRRRSHRKTSAARGFAPSSLPFRLSELVQKTKPRSSKCSRTTVRAAGRPSVDAVASTTGSCSSRHHSSNTRIGSACTRYRYPAAKSRCLDVSLEAVEGPIGMIAPAQARSEAGGGSDEGWSEVGCRFGPCELRAGRGSDRSREDVGVTKCVGEPVVHRQRRRRQLEGERDLLR